VNSLTRRLLVTGFSMAVILNLLTPTPPRVDFGVWRAVVVHSDDWGLEGWFPTGISDSLLTALSADVPDWQAAYLQSTLETGAEVDSLADWFSGIRDLDDLPLVLQANTILAGPSVREPGGGAAWPIHESGSTGEFSRPGLRRAIDAAIARGVWWPELHGLTHYNLRQYARARADGDPLAGAAALEGVFAYSAYRRDSELDETDADHARETARRSVDRFATRFGRPPTSVIAPDYRWGAEDELAWAESGIRVVQAKREQVDRSLSPHTRVGRLRKWIARRRFALSGGLFAVERSVDLEPYGDGDATSQQGAAAAARSIEVEFRKGRPGVVSIHRVQLVSRNADIGAAGRAQLGELMRQLKEGGGVRFLVDAEVEQLARRGWSILERGPWTVLRNWGDAPVRVVLPSGESGVLPARSSAVSGKFGSGLSRIP
jgi:hypothetical protein